MPYYIYRITELGPVKNLKKLAEFGVFKEASVEAKRLRKEEEDATRIKVMFADNELQAEDLLSQVREPEPMLGDD
ncbi:MAG: hypothetical protein PHU46_00595 [Rhodocyclaceae bacterium]|nr:hypothetical protein [Rhodocyclaceae bacterium]